MADSTVLTYSENGTWCPNHGMGGHSTRQKEERALIVQRLHKTCLDLTASWQTGCDSLRGRKEED